MSEMHLCRDCGIDTDDIGEMYMVHDDLWERVAGPVYFLQDCGVVVDRWGPGVGMLCVGCFERRLGRELVPEDFTDAPLNWCPMQWNGYQSPRLQSRLRMVM